MAGGGVFLSDSVFREVGFEGVSTVESVSAGGEFRGEDHAVVGQSGGWLPVVRCRFLESVEHYFCGDAVVGADVEGEGEGPPATTATRI